MRGLTPRELRHCSVIWLRVQPKTNKNPPPPPQEVPPLTIVGVIPLWIDPCVTTQANPMAEEKIDARIPVDDHQQVVH